MLNSSLYPPLDLKETITPHRLKGLWHLMKGFRLTYLGAIGALAIGTLAKTYTYLLLAYFIDNILFQENPAFPFYVIALGFLGLALVQGGFTFLSGKMAARSAEGIILRTRNYLFDHLQRLPFTYHDKTQTGDLVQRCSSDIDTIQRFFANEAIGVGRILLLFIVNFIALFTLNVRLALLSLITTPIVFGISLFFFKKIHTAYEEHQEQEGLLSSTLQENLTGVRVVKAFARQPFEIDKYEEVNQELYRLGKRLVFMHGAYWPIVETLSGAQMLFIFYLGAVMTISGEITIGTYIAIAGLVIWIIWPMQNLGRLIVQTSMGLVSYTRIAEIIAELREELDSESKGEESESAQPSTSNESNSLIHPKNGYHSNGSNGKPKENGVHAHPTLDDQEAEFNPKQPVRGDIEFKDVCFGYDDNTSTLNNITFKVEAGQTIALLGPTGSGKSSLINLLSRFYDFQQGTILLDGVDLRRYPLHHLRQQIGIVEQEPFLFSRTIAENIAYGVQRSVSQEEIEAAAKTAAIHDIILTFPDGYDTIVGEKGVTLSGGQKQRVTIARTLLKNAPILIFDDAVSAVDTETEAQIHEALENLRHRKTTFMIAHRIQTVMRADKILVLDQGRIVQHGSHETLMGEEGIYRKIYQLQAQLEEDV
ncbi:MAG: ABC transporter ATP-binding protein [Chloroflexota bacterium]